MTSIDPAALLLLISNLVARNAELEQENTQLRAALESRQEAGD